MEIIDVHTHLYHPGDYYAESMWPTFESRIAVLREAGVTQAVTGPNESVAGCSYETLLERNRRIAASCQQSEGLFIPAAEIQPALGDQACELLKRCRYDFGMRFIGEMFDRWLGFEWGTPEYYAVLECAIELHMIPLIHCEDAVAQEIGTRYPEGKFIIAHLRGNSGNCEERIRALAPYPNLSIDISGREMFEAGTIRDATAGLGADRVFFGSDLGAVDPRLAVQCLKDSGINESEQAQVFAGNFHKLWAWSEG